MRKVFIMLLLGSFSLPAFNQDLPANRITDWSIAGNDGIENLDFPTVNFYDYGGFGNGLTPNDALINQLIDDYNGSGVIIYFPEGSYLFNQSIHLTDNVILKGESSENAILLFNLNGIGHCIQARGNALSLSAPLIENTTLNEYTIHVEDASGFETGDYFQIYENDAAIVFSEWAVGCAGQINKIAQINDNEISCVYPIRRTFYTDRIAAIKKLNLIENVRVEELTIRRLDATPDQTNNIYFNYAVNCRVNCIQSFNCNFSHIEMSNSTNMEVTGSYFKDGFGYGSGGKAYGINLDYSTGQCLIENNIFEHLRHSMLVQLGANGNVFGYNYSKNPFWTEVGILPANSAGDMVAHGNYPYLNLFEGNVVQNIVIDDSHGINGPFNTFFRNRAQLYGIFMNFAPASNQQNFIGNEITNGNFAYGLYSLAGTGHFQYGNNKLGNTLPAGTTDLTTESLYLSQPPAYHANSWPPIGLPNLLNEHQIEVKDRFENNLLTLCEEDVTSADVNSIKNAVNIFPNLTSGMIYISCPEKLFAQMTEIRVYSLKGDLMMKKEPSTQLNINHLLDGIYILRLVFADNTEISKKVIKKL